MVVRPADDEPGKYRLTGGHRRRLALLTLYAKDPDRWREVDARLTTSLGALADQARLILMNRTARKETEYENMMETVKTAEIAREFKAGGGKVEGKTRAAVAAALGISSAQAGKYQAIYKHLTPTLIIFAASAASIIAMAGHSAISPVGQLMIHNVASTAEGDYRAMHHAGDVLETANDSLANAYMRKSGKTRDEIRAMMDAETWITAQRAVELGLVDEIMGGDLVAGLGAELLPDSVIQKTLAMFRADKSAELAQAETDYQNLLKKE